MAASILAALPLPEAAPGFEQWGERGCMIVVSGGDESAAIRGAGGRSEAEVCGVAAAEI